MNNKPINILPVVVLMIVAFIAGVAAAAIDQSSIRDVLTVIAGTATVFAIDSILNPSNKVKAR